MWPFVLWGLLIVAANGIAFALLDKIAGPVALFNVVNYVKVRAP